jgi:hypothetical protein
LRDECLGYGKICLSYFYRDNCTKYDWYKDDHYEERIDILRFRVFSDVDFNSIYVTFHAFISQGYIKVRFGPLTCVSGKYIFLKFSKMKRITKYY